MPYVLPVHIVSNHEATAKVATKYGGMAETSVNAFVWVCGRKYLANKSSHSKTTRFNWEKFHMFNITSAKLLEPFHTQTISQPWVSAVSGTF